MRGYGKVQTPMQALRAVLALGVDGEGDIIVPGRLSRDDGGEFDNDLVRALRRVVRDNKGVK